jgi:tape measure domain-containing protein
MAEGVRLDLQVGLDIAYLQNQLSTIGTKLGGQTITLPIEFSKRDIVTKTKALQKYIGNKTFDIKIESNTLAALANKVKNFKDRLDELKKEDIELKIKTGAIVSLSKRDGAKVMTDLRAAVLGDSKKLLIPTSIKSSITRADVRDFTNAVKSKLSGLSVKVKADLEMSAVRGGAKSQAEIDAEVLRGYEAISRMGAERMKGGGVTEAARREQLKQRLSTGEFDIGQLRDIGAQLGVKGAGRFRNTQNLIEKIVAEASVEMIKKYLDPQAVMRNPNRGPLLQVLDTFARGVFHMMGLDPATLRAAQVQTIQSAVQTMQVARSSSGGLPAGVTGLLPSVTQRTAISQGVQGIYRGFGGQGGEEGPGGALVDVKRIYAALQKNLDEILRRNFAVIEVDVRETSTSLKTALHSFSYLVQALRDAETRAKRSRVDAAVDSLMKAIEQSIKVAKARLRIVPAEVADLGAPTQRMLQGQRIAGFLPPATRITTREARIQRAYRRSEERGYDVMAGGSGDRVRGVGQPPERGGAIVPYAPSTRLPENYFENMRRMNAAMEVARSSLRNFSRDQLPLIGGLRGLAGEFGEATKQVLLYGTAYKGLAFITSLPGQILNAAKGQQQFANSMQVATDKTKTFAKEMLFIDNLQRAYGLNLDTTRQGFVRLFASMAPSGFDSGSIEKLFTGISAATAALQLTPDRAERVIYAFGQMASKGQVMSEELKGQLGDVLPGALSIFADAAGKSISEFNKDLEDGVYKGEKFRELMAKVTDELIERFGTGAQVAGRSLQGLLNTVQGDFQRTLEAFSPLANAAAQAILVPIGGALRQLSISAQLATGEADRVRKQLEDQQKIVSDLKIGGADTGQIRAAEQNVAALQARLEMLNEAAKDPAIQKQAQDIQKFTQELAKAGTFVMNVAQTIGSILSPALTFLGGNLTTVIALVTSVSLGFQAMRLAAMVAMGALVAFRAIMTALGLTETARSATAVAAGLRMLGINASGAAVQIVGTTTALRVLASATVIGAVVTGITLIAGAFLSMRDSANEAKKATIESLKASREARLSGSVLGVETQLTKTKAQQFALEDFAKELDKYEKNRKKGDLTVSAALKRTAQDANISLNMIGNNSLRRMELDVNAARQALNNQRQVSKQTRQQQEQDVEAARRREKQLGLNQPTPAPFPTGADATSGKPPKTPSMEGYYSLQDQLAKNFTEDQIRRIEQEYQARVNRINTEFDIREARANSFHKEAIQYERKLSEIALAREKAVMEASNEVLKAREGVVRSTSGGKGMPGGIAQYITGDPSSPYYKKDHGGSNYHEHLAFVSRQAAEEAYSKLTQAGIKVTEFKGKSRVGRHSPGSAHYEGLAFDVPGAQVPVGKERELTARVQSVLGIGAGVPRGKVGANERRDTVSLQKEQLAIKQKSVAVQIAEMKAIQDAAVAWAQYSAAIAPIEEQQLQNRVLAKKNELMKAGMPDDVVDKELKYFEAQEKTRIATELLTKLVDEKKISLEEAGKRTKELQERLAKYNIDLAANIELQKQQRFDATMNSLRDQLALAGIVDPRGERRAELMQGGASREKANEQALLEERISQAKRLRDAYRDIASSIGDSFGTAFKGMITGSMTAQEALAGMFQSIADSFADMVAKMIAEWMKAQILGIFQKILSPIAAGFSFGGSSGGFDLPGFQMPGYMEGVTIPKFATGGIVTGPTLGLVGEGRYNEAVVPLPDGRSIPVDLGNARNNGDGGSVNVVVNVDASGSKVAGDNEQANQLGRVVSQAVQAELIKQKRPGGLLY